MQPRHPPLLKAWQTRSRWPRGKGSENPSSSSGAGMAHDMGCACGAEDRRAVSPQLRPQCCAGVHHRGSNVARGCWPPKGLHHSVLRRQIARHIPQREHRCRHRRHRECHPRHRRKRARLASSCCGATGRSTATQFTPMQGTGAVRNTSVIVAGSCSIEKECMGHTAPLHRAVRTEAKKTLLH